MRVMVIVKADERTEAGVMPDQELLARMGNYNEELVKAGVMQAGEGLHPSSRGVRVRFDGERRTVTDGPFAETKELIAGFWLWKVESMQDAVEWLKRAPFDAGAELEIRQVFEADDFGEAFTPELREQEDRLRAEVASREAQASIAAATAASATQQANGMKTLPYLNFDGTCAEAFRFYADVLRADKLEVMTHGDSPIAAEIPPDWHPRVLHAYLEAGGAVLMASDTPPGYDGDPRGMYVSLQVGSSAEAERIFAALADGGKVTMPLEKTFWAERFGMLVDRYGTPWMVNYAG
jgi:PhnB protein